MTNRQHLALSIVSFGAWVPIWAMLAVLRMFLPRRRRS